MDLMLMDFMCVDKRPSAIDATAPLTGAEANDAMASAEPDSGAPKALLIMIGRADDGQSVCACVEGYKPWVRLMYQSAVAPANAASSARATIIAHLALPYESVTIVEELLPRFYGFVPNASGTATLWPCLKVYVPTFAAASRLESAWRYNSRPNLTKLWTLTDATTPKEVRALNELGLEPSGWFTFSGSRSGARISTCNIELAGHINGLTPRPDMTAVAPIKILSFDAEMFSHDNGFPEVINGDFAVAICATIATYGSTALERHAFIVSAGPLTTVTPMKIYYCSSPEDLMEQFRDLVVKTDPDILTGWNIYGFDMPFLWDSYQSAHANPKSRGSEALHESLLDALKRPGFLTTAKLMAKTRAREARTLIDAMPRRHRAVLRKSAALPEAIAEPLRAVLRSAAGLDKEPTFGGPDDLSALRLMAKSTHVGPSGPMQRPTNRAAALFKCVVDKPRTVGLRRGEFLGRMALERSTLTEKRMSSAAKGDNTYNFWSGRCCVDLMQIIKDDKKLDDNTLKFAAQTFLDPEFGKLDMTPAEMFKAYRTSDAKALGAMLDYCARDADIPILLIDRLSYVPIWIEMSRVTFTGLHQVLNGGQQRRVYNLIAHFVHSTHAINACESGWPVSPVVEDEPAELDAVEDSMRKRKPDYQGATVIEPKIGFYTEAVSTLDFESLYPSIMIHFNLCPSVYVTAGAGTAITESHTIQHSILMDTKDTYNEFSRNYVFVKNVEGVVPRLLQHLLKARKAAKRAMAVAPDDFERSVQNGRQLALKVSCNSVYGFFGVAPGRGLMSCKPVAAVTTLKGRAFIEAAKAYVESNLSASVIYGDTDSIMIKWPAGIDVPKAYQLAEEASGAITELLRNGLVEGATRPILASALSAVTLANEKVYTPYLLIQKKTYAGFKYVLKSKSPDSLADFETSIDMKGVDAVRRDRSKLVKTLSSAVLDALLINKSLEMAFGTLKTVLAQVSAQKAPLDWFVLSKSLKSTYHSENQPHVQAWKRMAARGDDGVPEVGTRMPYVIVAAKQGAKAGPLYERTEHPAFVTLKGLHYCARYYLENAQDVIQRLLGPTGLGPKVTALFAEAIGAAEHKSSGNMSLMSFKRLRSN